MSKGKSNQHKDAEQSSKTRFYQAFFDSVKGKEVKVYRAGPEAKHGVVLDVQSDYVALAVKNSVIYYQAEHIKSVSSPTKPKPHHPEQEHKEKEKEKEKEKVNFLSAKNFRKLLKKMEQQVVQLNQGGPDSIHGKLLAVKHDFLIMHTEDDGHVYVSIHHVKSVSLSSKPFKEKEKKKDKMIEAHDLLGVFKHLENKWVAINRSGPEAVEGVLSVDDGYYKLTHNEEVILVDPFHVRSISSGPKKKKDKDKDKDKGKDKHDRKDGKKDGHDGKGKGKECDCKDCKKCCKCSGMDRFRDCKGNNNKDNDKDNDKDNSKSNKRCKDWFDKNSNKKDRGSMKSCNDDNRKNDNDKDNKDNNNDDDKDNNKDDNSKDNNNSNKDK